MKAVRMAPSNCDADWTLFQCPVSLSVITLPERLEGRMAPHR